MAISKVVVNGGSMSISKVVVVDGNNLIVRIDRGIAGRSVTDVVPVEIDNSLYLEFYFSDGTTETVGPVGTIQYIGQSPIVVQASTISLSTVPVSLGGTGQITANAGFNALAPSQATNAGKYLKTDGTNSAWDVLDISTADITGTLPVTNGGTGATTASGARTNLNAADQATTISAGTGLSGGGDLSANRTLSIANTTVTAAAYGSASKTLTATVNAQGQLTALADTPIAIANTQISGLGTMSTQDATSVAITGGSITGITDLAVNDGGTGASDASGARTNLGAAALATTITAGTGLSGGGDLSANRTLSIANTTVTAAAYGSVSDTLTATVNAQGQLTSLAATPIAIANTQVSGLGTMSTQSAASVAITGGSITGITDLAIADGGTGASTAADARTNLGLGTAAVLNAGVALGVATLDAGGTVPLSQIPASIQGGVSYQGSWNASTNTPTLTSSVGSKGYYYVVSVAGSTNLNGITDWLPGDWAIFNGSVWEQIDNTDTVASVNGYTGAVVLTSADVGAAPTTRTISAGTGLSGGGDLSANRTISLANTTVTAASYGDASKTLTATVNAQGQLTALAETSIAIANTQVSGLGTMSTQNASSVSITGGSITGITDLAIADGGTGQSTANAAFNALAPSQTGNTGKYLTTDGSNTSWGTNPLGTVTSVDVSGGTTGLTTTGGPVTTSGTITLAGTLAVTNGGTGVTTSTGGGSVVLNTSPLLITPTLSGATVDNAAPYLNFTPTTAPTYLEGRLFYDSAAHTLNYYNDNSQMSVNIGQENVIRVRNQTGSTIPEGSVVYINGATGNTPTISLAIATAFATADIIGVATTTISNNGFGYATTSGLVNDLNLSAFTEGQAVFVSPTTPGALTATEPVAPNYSVQVGVVLRANPSNGTLLVSVQMISTEVSHIVGAMLIGQGGTGQTTANAAFNALAPSQTGNTGKYLTTDGSNTSWATNPLGTVTSVAATVPSFLSITGSPITTSGTLAFGLSGTALPTTSGGTGLSSFTANGVVYASSTSALATNSALTFDGSTLVVGTTTASSGSTITTDRAGFNILMMKASGVNKLSLYADASISAIDGNTNPLVFYTASAEQMRLTSTGLGIGTSSPATKLEVLNSVEGEYFRAGGGTISGRSLQFSSFTVIGLTGVGHQINVPNANGVLTFAINSTEQMRLTSTGLGIGTSSPAYKLDVSGTGRFNGVAGSNLIQSNDTTGAGTFIRTYADTTNGSVFNVKTGDSFRWATSASDFSGFSEQMRLTSTGLVIGTSSTDRALTVYTTDSSGKIALFSNGYLNTNVYISADPASGSGVINVSNNAATAAFPLMFQMNGTERMRLDTAGNLGIGTSSPGYRLQVSGTSATVAISASNISASSTSTLLFRNVDGNGNIYDVASIDGASAGNGGYGNLVFKTAFNNTNTERMRLDSAGNLGLGVTPSGWPGASDNYNTFQFGVSSVTNVANVAAEFSYNQYIDTGGTRRYISTNTAMRYRMGNTQHQWFTASSGTAGAAISFTQAMTLDASGNLLLGASSSISPSRLWVEGNFVSNNGIGFNSTAASGTAYLQYFLYNGSAVGSISSSGTITTYNTTSDYRLKTVIGSVSGSGARIDALEPVEYTWNSNGERTRGFLAHQFQEVYAGSVSGTKDAVDANGKPVYQAMQASSSEVIADLVAELQSVRQRLTALEAA